RKQEGGKKYELQREVMQSSRQQEAELAALGEQTQTYRSTLADLNDKLRGLESRTRKAFAGYGAFRRLVVSAKKDPSLEPDTTADEPALLKQVEDLLNQGRHELSFFRQRFLPNLFRFLPYPL